MRKYYIYFVLLLLLASCGREPQPADSLNPFRLRSRAKINAERDTKEGYLAAAEYLKRLMQRGLGNASDHLNLAKVLFFLEDYAACQNQLEQSRALFNQHEVPPDLDYIAGLCLKRQLRHAEALKCFVRLTDKQPWRLKAWFQRGQVAEELKLLDQAESCYQKALTIDAQHRASLYRLIFVLEKLDKTAASQRMERLFAALPKVGQEDNEKCDLTMVSLRPLERAKFEAPPVSFSWTDISDRVLPAELANNALLARPYYRGQAAFQDKVSVSWGSSVFMEEGQGAGADLVLIKPTGITVLTQAQTETAPAQKISTLIKAENPEDCLIADFNNDGLNDLLIQSEQGLTLHAAQEQSSFAPGLTLLNAEIIEAGGYDLDHDGDLDIVATVKTEKSTTALYLRNNGDGSFKTLTPFESLVTTDAPTLTFTAHDLDQANDLDFIFAGAAAGIQVFLNKRDGTFKRVVLSDFGDRKQALVEDLNNDGAPDFFTTGGGPGWSYAMNANPAGKPYDLGITEPIHVTAPACGAIHDSCCGDIDNDGDLDVLLASNSGIVLLRNTAGGKLIEEEAMVLPDGYKAITVDVADLTGDGMLEVLVGTDVNRPMVLASGANPAYASWKVWLEGRKDNHNAIGAVVEQYAGLLYQSRLLRRAGPLHLGLGKVERREIDGVRFRWPQGIVQTACDFEIKPDSHGNVRFTQIEALVSSCPFLYARGKNGWQFVTDVLGIAPLDEWLPAGKDAHLDPEEYVRIDGDALHNDQGLLHLAITEELRETAYLDRLELISVDHPEDHEVFINASTKQADYESLKLVVAPNTGLSVPSSFILPDGTDQTELVRYHDNKYAHGYKPAPSQWSGWVEQYTLRITTSAPSQGLLLRGRIAWYDSTTTFALNQHGRVWGPLSLGRLDPSGGLSSLVADLGLPTGMDRQILALFGARPLPAGGKIQLACHHRFLWDQVLSISEFECCELAATDQTVRLKHGAVINRTSCNLRKAVCGFHGFSKSLGDKARHEQDYLYDQARPDDMYLPATGFATAYGDVRSLLHEHDDKLLVLVAGDKVEVAFEAPANSPPGRRRTYFLRVTGWAKEGSYHNLTGSSIGPLPFRAMSSYPPPLSERRQDRDYLDYLQASQTREIRRRTF
jgi:tetratricopeptide (TPR) repeat protein